MIWGLYRAPRDLSIQILPILDNRMEEMEDEMETEAK